MAERLRPLPKGVSKYVRGLKAETRHSDSEEDSWPLTEAILRIRVEGYPGRFLRHLGMIREFHRIRWDISHGRLLGEGMKLRIRTFQEGHTDESFEQVQPALSLITKILS